MANLEFKTETPEIDLNPEQQQQQPAGRKGRGRPPGSVKNPPPPPPIPPGDKKPGLSDEDRLKQKLADYKAGAAPVNAIPTEQTQQAVQGAMVTISGAAFLSMLDFVAPRVLMFVYGFIDERTKYIDIKDLKLTPGQIKELEPIADEVAKIVFNEVNPVYAFCFMYAVNMFSNMEEALINAEEKQQKVIAEKSKKKQRNPEAEI